MVFPTETVYGIGADYKNPAAVSRIFEVKRRPRDNPLILHGHNLESLKKVALFKKEALDLARAFWPGAMTLILPAITGESDSIAVRIPLNESARLLIKKSETLIAAPSANISGRVSPTCARHVELEADLILDGGQTEAGLESTVIDLYSNPKKPRVLRPGIIDLEDIKRVIPNADFLKPGENAPPTPGLKYRHYAPRAKLIISSDLRKESYETKKGEKIAILDSSLFEPKELARVLYKTLSEFDEAGADIIIVSPVSEEGVGVAIMNRLRKAANEI